MPKILALKFELETDSGSLELIAWIENDGNGKYLVPAHPSKTLLDMTAGDVVIWNRQQFTVKRLKPWRTTECKDDTQYREVESGAVWEATAG